MRCDIACNSKSHIQHEHLNHTKRIQIYISKGRLSHFKKIRAWCKYWKMKCCPTSASCRTGPDGPVDWSSRRPRPAQTPGSSSGQRPWTCWPSPQRCPACRWWCETGASDLSSLGRGTTGGQRESSHIIWGVLRGLRRHIHVWKELITYIKIYS